MPQKKTARSPKQKRSAAQRVRSGFLLTDDNPVETDLRYWMIHILHWHALLVAVIAIILVGMNFFGRI